MMLPMKRTFERRRQSAENDRISPATSALVRMADDGCWYNYLFDFTDSRQFSDLRAKLLDLIDKEVRLQVQSGEKV